MKVCDHCHQKLSDSNSLKLKDKDFELCNDCASRIKDWIEKEEKKGLLRGLFGK